MLTYIRSKCKIEFQDLNIIFWKIKGYGASNLLKKCPSFDRIFVSYFNKLNLILRDLKWAVHRALKALLKRPVESEI